MGKEKVFNPSRRSLYDQMKNHYDLPEYDKFESYLDDDNNRKALFDDLSGQSLLGDVKDFDEFETLIKPRVSPELRSEFITQSAAELKKDLASRPSPFEPDKTQYQSPVKQEAAARETQGSPVLQQAMLDTALMESGMLPQLQSDIQKEIQEQESTDQLLNTYREAKIRTLIEEIEDLSSNQNIKGNREAESYAQSVNDELAAYTPEEVESVRKKIIVERSQSYAKKRINELNAQKGKSVWTAIQDGDFGDPNRLFTGRLKEKSDLIKSQRTRLDEKNLLQEAVDQPNKSQGKFNDFVKGIESELGTNLIPFVGNAVELEKFSRIREITQKQDRTDDEQAVVDAYAALQNVKNNSEFTPMFYNIGKGATAMTPYALEFALTSGVYSTAKNIMQHGIIKLIGRETVKEVLENAAKKNIVGLFNKGALKGVASLGAGVTQSLANPLGIAVDFEQRGIPLLSLGMSKEGEIVERNAIGSPDESITKLLKSIGVNAAEYVSERFGYAVEKPTEMLAKMAVGKFLAKYGADATENQLESIAKKLGWNGIIAEFAEEFLNKPMQTAIEKGSIEFMTPEESLETLGIVAVPGLGGKAVKYSAKAFNAIGSLPKLDPSELKNDKPQSGAESEGKTTETPKPEHSGSSDITPSGNEVNPPEKVEPSKPAAAPEPEKKVQLKPEERAEFIYPNLIERLDQEGEDAPISVSSVISMIPELQSGDRKSNVKTATKLIQRLHQEGLAADNVYKKKKDDPEQPWKDKAGELGITFVGMQSVPGKESIPLFTDPESGSTFVKSESETVEQALERKREQFKQSKPVTPESSETPEVVTPPVVPAAKEADKKPDGAVVVKGDDEGLFPGEKLTLKPFVRPELPFKNLDVKSSEKVLDYNARIQDILSARYKGYLDVLDNRINSIDAEITKSAKGSALSKALEHEQIKLKIEREQWEKEYGDLVEERYVEHRESILYEATKRGVIFVDETEENDFVDDFLLQIGNDNATAEKNGEKSIKDVFDSVTEKYLAKGEEDESPAVEPQKGEPEPVEPTVESKQPKNEVIPPADIAQVSEDILDKTWIKRRSEGQYIQDNNTFTRQDPLAESDGKVAFGKNTSVVFAKDVNAPARYAVIDVSLLQPSHISGSPNKLHFIPEAQPKNRSQSESNRNQNQEMAENLDPEQILVGKTAYVGAPTVNDRGEIIQGNGRGGTARIYWSQYPDDPKGLKSTIKEYASVFGLDEEKIDAIKHPVVVRVFTGNDNQSITLGQYEVSDLESVANKTTKATAMSRKMSDEDVQKIAEMIHRADSGEFDKPIGEIIQAAGLPIVDTLISGGAINADKRETYFSRDGRISPDGVESIKNILVNFLFRGGNTNVPELFRKTPANFQAAVERSVHFLLSSKASINTEIQNAIMIYDGFIKSGMGSVMDFIRQPGLTESAPIDKYGVESSAIALMIEQPQRELIAKFKRYFLKTNGTPGDMFSEGNPPLPKRESFAAFDPFFAQAKEYGLPDADNKFFGGQDVDVSVFEPRSTYKAMKAKYPGTIFLIRKGENYVARGQDAIDINNALGAKPSKANIYEIPASAIQQILPRLSKAGLRIGVADQIEETDSQIELGFDSPETKTFTTTDGESIRYQNVSGESRYKRSPGNRMVKSPSTRKLDKNEHQVINRLYRKSPFKFFGASERINGPKDVAVLFRQLETESVEHCFVVHVRDDGKAIIQHLSTGLFNSTLVSQVQFQDLIERFGSKELYFVHNHPSGNLEPSREDLAIHTQIENSLGGKVILHDSIIINLKSGKYSTFNPNYGLGSKANDSTQGIEGKVPFKTLSFTRQALVHDVELKKISHPESIASFITSSRFSSGKKWQVLAMNPMNQIVGRFCLTAVPNFNSEEGINNVVNEVSLYTIRSGGISCALIANIGDAPKLSGNGTFNQLRKSFEKKGINLLDIVGVEPSSDIFESSLDNGAQDVIKSGSETNINTLSEPSSDYASTTLNEKAYNGLYKINGFFIEKGIKTPSVLARLAALKIGNNIIKYPGEFKKSVIDALGFFAESPSAEFTSASTEQIRTMLENAITENKNGQTENEIIGQYIRAVRTNAAGSGNPNAGTDGGFGHSGRPGLRVVDEGNIPQPTEIVPVDRFAISEHQRLAVNLALTRFVEKKKKAFLLADGTGAGKTRTEIIVAYELAKRLKKPALITTYDDTVIEGFRRESQALGIDLEASNIEIGTYYNLAAGKKAGSKGGAEYARRDYSVHILDEAHRIKNVDSIRAQMSSAVKSDHLVYATATPMDKPLHSAYFMSEVIEQSPEEIAKQLGFEIVKTPMPDGKIETSVIPLSNMSWLVVLDNLLKMRDQAIADGAMIRREYPFFGTVNKKMVQFSQEQRDELDQVEQYWNGFIKAAQARIQPMIDALQYRFDRGEINPAKFFKELQIIRASKNFKKNPLRKSMMESEFGLLRELSYWTEMQKLQTVFDDVIQALDEGKRVIVYAQSVNPGTLEAIDQDPTKESTIAYGGFLKTLGEMLSAKSIDFARIYGSDSDKITEADRFQRGTFKVALATMESGGVGINLDDTSGDAPRKMLIVTANYAGDATDQAMGRISRMNTKSASEVIFYFAPEARSDRRRGVILGKKMNTLRRIQSGEDPDRATFEVPMPAERGSLFDPVQKSEGVWIEPYLDGFVIVKGSTASVKGALKKIGGGRYNGTLKGWIFQKSKRKAIENELSGVLSKPVSGIVEVKEPAADYQGDKTVETSKGVVIYEPRPSYGSLASRYQDEFISQQLRQGQTRQLEEKQRRDQKEAERLKRESLQTRASELSDRRKQLQREMEFKPTIIGRAELTSVEKELNEITSRLSDGLFSREDDQQSLFRLDQAPGKGLTKKRLEQLFKPFITGLKDQSIVQIVSSKDDVPDNHKKYALPGVKAFFLPVKGRPVIHFIASEIRDEVDALKTFIHEMGAHYGIRGYLGYEKSNELYRQLWNDYQQEIRQAEWFPRYSTFKQYDPNTSRGQIALAEEYVARSFAEPSIDEEGNIVEPSFMEKIVAAIRGWLRDIGVKTKVSDEEIKALLHRSYEFIRGERPGYYGKSGGLRYAIERKNSSSLQNLQLMHDTLSELLPETSTAANLKDLVQKYVRVGKFPQEAITQSQLMKWIDSRSGAITKSDILKFVTDAISGVSSETTDAIVKSDGYPLPLFLYAGENISSGEGDRLIDNLTIAIEMEQSFRTADQIRLATGWFKGLDGKWRVEIDDSNAKVIEQMWKRMISNEPHYSDPLDGTVQSYTSEGVEKYQLVDKDGNLIQNGFSTKDEATQWFSKYGGEFRIPNTAYLDELLDHQKLFALYPQLKDVKVSAVPPVRGQHGAFFGDRATIEISALAENATQIKSILMHEVQHAIQYLEGFASGSNYWTVGEFKYRRSAGEIESRDVQNRLRLDDLTRQDVPPIRQTLLDEGIQEDEILLEFNGVSHSVKEDDLIEKMNKDASPFREVKLNKLNWIFEFGREGIVKTPIGDVKMGENQFNKMNRDDRKKYFGLIKPTLEDPQIVVKDDKEGTLFIKTFTVPNAKTKYFVSVSYNIDGIDVVVSNHVKGTNLIKKIVGEGRLQFTTLALTSSASDQAPSEQSSSTAIGGGSDISNLRIAPDDVNTDDLDDEVRFSIASNPAITEAKQRIDAMAEDRRELFKSDANDAYKDPLKGLGWITRPSVVLGKYSKLLQRAHDVVIAEESFMQDAVMEESKALMKQINEHLYSDMPEKSDRTGFEVLDFVWRMNQRKKLDSFLRMSIPLAAHLNAVGGEASNWEFKEFDMRAGFISKMQLEKLRQSNPGLGVGQTIEVVNPLLTQVSAIKAADEKGLKDAERRAFIAEFMETSPVMDQRIIGEELSDTAGKPGYQLKRVVAKEMQESLYKIYENEYPSFIHIIDQFIDPRLAKKTKEINGIKVPTFNRFALAELMKLNDQEFQDVTGYTPDVYISRSLIGTVKDLGRAIFGGQKSPGRKYKTGAARETGNVQDILKGFNIRAFQALREKARQEFVRMAMATSVPVPANDAIPEGWVKIEDGISTVIQAIETAKKMRLKPFTREMTPDERKKYGKMVLLPEWIVDINLESNTITIQPAHEIKKRLRPQDNLIRDYDFGEFVREARALEGEKRMMPKRVLEILVQQFDSYKVQNGLLRMINYMAQEAALSLLVFPATFMVNYNTNKLFTMEKLGRSTTSLIAKGLLRTVGIKTDPAGEFNALKEVAVVSAKGMFLGIQKRIGTDFAKHVEQVVPAALFKHSTVLSDVVANDFDSAKKSIRRGSIAGAMLQVLGYGNIDIKSKQRYALSFLTARAKAEASKQGLTGVTRKTFVAQWLSNVTMKDRMDAVRAAEFEYLNYKDIPHDLTRFQQKGWSRLFIPFIRFGYSYTLKQKDKIWDKGLVLMMQGETVDQRVEGFANALWATMVDFGLIGILYGLLGFGDDEDARQIVGASQTYEETPGGQLRKNSLSSDLNTENRANISKMAPQWFVGWMKQSGIVGDDEDAWLRLRNYPMLYLPMLGMLSANDARKHGIGEGIATYLNGLIDLGKDFFNFGFAVKTPVKGLQSITGERDNWLDKYGSNIPFVTYTTMNALDALVPWGRQSDEIVLFLDPVRRRTSESRTLDYNTEIGEQFKNGLVIGHIPGIVHRMITEGEDLPPTGRVETVSLRPSPSEKPETSMKRQLAISLLSQESPNARLYMQERKDRTGVFKPTPRIAFLEPREPKYSPARELLRLLGGVNIKPVNTQEYERAISIQNSNAQESE